MDERGASEGMSGAGAKRPADLSLALPIAKRAKRLEQSAWDEALNDHRAASEIGWVCFPPSLRAACGSRCTPPGLEPWRTDSRSLFPRIRRSLDLKWRTLLKPLQLPEGLGHPPAWARGHGHTCSTSSPSSTRNAHSATCAGARSRSLQRRARAWPLCVPTGAAAVMSQKVQSSIPCSVLMRVCVNRLRRAGIAQSIAGRLCSLAGQGIRIPRGGSAEGARRGRNTAGAWVLRAADAHRASARRGDDSGGRG
jgi:hypothetical protein